MDRTPQEDDFIQTLPIADLDKGIVGWESQDDPDLPLNFTAYKKCLILLPVTIFRWVGLFAASALSPAIESLRDEYHEQDGFKAQMPTSMFVFGTILGPLFFSSASDIYGRHIVLLLATTVFCLCTAGCALSPTFDTLIVFRLFCGISASAGPNIGSVIITDLLPPRERGRLVSICLVAMILGLTSGPLISTIVTHKLGWRWVNWIILCPSAAVTGSIAIFGLETNPGTLLSRKTRKLQKELGRPDLRSAYISSKPDMAHHSNMYIMMAGLTRPLRLLFISPPVLIASFTFGAVFGYILVFFSVGPLVFKYQYGWDLLTTNFTYLSFLIGNIVGLAVCYKFCNRTTHCLGINATYEPEMRLWGCSRLAMTIPFTFLLHGVAVLKNWHWIIVLISLLPLGLGNAVLWVCFMTYVMEISPQYASSCITALIVLGNLISSLLLLAGATLYRRLGAWALMVFGFISLGIVVAIALLERYGKWLRMKFPID